MSSSDYWDTRGSSGFMYRGEWLYTITPAPLYVARRRLFLDKIEQGLSAANSKRAIVEVGCGDGYYLHELAHRLPGMIKWYGVEPSEAMVRQASRRCPQVTFVSHLRELPVRSLDAGFTVAVLAHLPDQVVLETAADIASLLAPGDPWFVCEQVAPRRYGGTQFTRRPVAEYMAIARNAGFLTTNVQIVDFNVHRIFERYAAKLYYRCLARGESEHAKRIDANRSMLFRALSLLCVRLSAFVLTDYAQPCWGYAILTLTRGSDATGDCDRYATR